MAYTCCGLFLGFFAFFDFLRFKWIFRLSFDRFFGVLVLSTFNELPSARTGYRAYQEATREVLDVLFMLRNFCSVAFQLLTDCIALQTASDELCRHGPVFIKYLTVMWLTSPPLAKAVRQILVTSFSILARLGAISSTVQGGMSAKGLLHFCKRKAAHVLW